MGSREKSSAYRQVLIEFANAEDVESACLGILDGLKKVFDFPDDFSEKVKKVFPRLSELTILLTQTEKEYIKSVYQCEDFEKVYAFLNPASATSGESYYSENEVFEYINPDDNSFWEATAYVKASGPIGATRYIEETYQAKKILNKLQTIFSKEMCSKIKYPFREIVQILDSYRKVFFSRKLLIGTLDHIASGKNLYECESFKKILDQRSETWVSNLELRPNGSLVWGEIFTFEKNPRFYFGSRDIVIFGLAALSCLIQFLLQFPESIKLIKKCPYCDKFFIAKDIKRKTRCYSKECDKEYQRKKKQKQREEDPVTYL